MKNDQMTEENLHIHNEEIHKKREEESHQAEEQILSQVTYRESPYEESSWEIVGEPPSEIRFSPLSFQVLESDISKHFNPMFADYGGLRNPDEKEVWHRPVVQGHMIDEDFKESHYEKIEREEGTSFIPEAVLEEVKQSAFQAGFEEGQRVSLEAHMRESEALKEQLSTIMQNISLKFNTELSKIEKSALELSLSISKRIIDTAVEINPEYIIDLIKKGLQLAQGTRIYTIKVSRQDMEFLLMFNIEKLMKEKQQTWIFEIDDAITSGCVIQTSGGEIDFQLDKAWERVKDEIVKIAK
jgi:flagellar biosynthesis/type III secretory pathway protein FliH